MSYMYGGTNYKEYRTARWAAFFDRLGWKYTATPAGLVDFTLQFKNKVDVYILDGCPFHRLHTDERAVTHVNRERDLLLLGAAPLFDGDRVILGRLHEGTTRPSWDADWDDAPAFGCTECDAVSFYHPIGSFHCRVNLCHDGDHHLGGVGGGWLRAQWHTASRLAAMAEVR
jgi:hypothetical protein